MTTSSNAVKIDGLVSVDELNAMGASKAVQECASLEAVYTQLYTELENAKRLQRRIKAV